MIQMRVYSRNSRAAVLTTAASITILVAASMAGAAERVVLAEYFTNLF